MAYPLQKSCAPHGAEYSIYIYHRPENYLDGQSDWERRAITFDFHQALQEALTLCQSRNFQKVEIRQRTTNPKTAQISDSTIKILTPEREGLWHKVFRCLGVRHP